jgi:hypothetical protein
MLLLPLQVSPYIAAVLQTLEQAGLRESVTDVDVAPGGEAPVVLLVCRATFARVGWSFPDSICCWLSLYASSLSAVSPECASMSAGVSIAS